MNVRSLCALELVQRHSRPRTRRTYYSVQSISFTAFLGAGARRFASCRIMIESGGAASLPGARPTAAAGRPPSRLEDSHRAVLERMSREIAAANAPR